MDFEYADNVKTHECTVSVDPGLRELGIALFHDDDLIDAELIEGVQDTSVRDILATQALRSSFDQCFKRWFGFESRRYDGMLVYERMQHYSKRPKADVDDLFQLVGAVHACFSGANNAIVEGYLPGTWTSGRPKDVNHDRIRRRLSGPEVDVVGDELATIPEGQHEHVLDAIGIGLYHLRRL